MIFFLVIIGILYIFSFCSFNERVSTFNKEHVLTLKGVMAISIVAFHLFYQTDDWLFMFSSWGAPIVSMFYFISGYGLALNYRAKGNEYLSHFFKHRIIDVRGDHISLFMVCFQYSPFLYSLLYDSFQEECCNHFIPLCLFIYSSYRFIKL